MTEVLQLLRSATLPFDGAELTDQRLLHDYVSLRDEAALTALVTRHGPMVWGVCRRVLSDYHAAEDAFQATFLVLVRRAATIAASELLGNWLYGVAYKTAMKARATNARRGARERQVTEMPEVEVVSPDVWLDLQPLLDRELSRLPEKYRVLIVLCDLEGKTRREVARQLGCPEGTVAGRLARARARLAARLARCGFVVTGGALGTTLSLGAASACVPASVVSSTIKAATAGVISLKVASLTEGVIDAMFLTKLKTVTVVFLAAALVAVGIGTVSLPALLAEPTDRSRPVALLGNDDVPKKPEGKTDKDAPKGKEQPEALPPRAGPPKVLIEHKSPVTCLAWAADGRSLAAGTEDGTVYVTEAATGKGRSFPTQRSAVTALAFSPDGKSLELFNQLLRQSTWNAGTGEQRGGHAQREHAVEHLAFMPGGEWVVGVTVQCFTKRQFVTSGPAEGLTRPGTPADGFAACAPDGTVSGYCNAKGRLIVLQSGPADAINFGDDFALDLDKGRCMAFGPGGKILAVGDDKGAQLWDLSTKMKTHTLGGLDQPAARLTISADGNTLAALADDGKSVLVWDLTRNTTRCQINHDRGIVGSLVLSPDGKMLATTVKDGKAIFLWKTGELDFGAGKDNKK